MKWKIIADYPTENEYFGPGDSKKINTNGRAMCNMEGRGYSTVIVTCSNKKVESDRLFWMHGVAFNEAERKETLRRIVLGMLNSSFAFGMKIEVDGKETSAQDVLKMLNKPHVVEKPTEDKVAEVKPDETEDKVAKGKPEVFRAHNTKK